MRRNFLSLFMLGGIALTVWQDAHAGADDASPGKQQLRAGAPQTPIKPSSGSPQSAMPRAVCTFASIGLYWTPDGGAEDKPCRVRYRAIGAPTWRQALPLWFDKRIGEYRGHDRRCGQGRPMCRGQGVPRGPPRSHAAVTAEARHRARPRRARCRDRGLRHQRLGARGQGRLGRRLRLCGLLEIRAAHARRDPTQPHARPSIEFQQLAGIPRGRREISSQGAAGHLLFRERGQPRLLLQRVYHGRESLLQRHFRRRANRSLRGFAGADSDVYGNRIEGCWDDGLEMEGGGCNVRVWGNRPLFPRPRSTSRPKPLPSRCLTPSGNLVDARCLSSAAPSSAGRTLTTASASIELLF